MGAFFLRASQSLVYLRRFGESFAGCGSCVSAEETLQNVSIPAAFAAFAEERERDFRLTIGIMYTNIGLGAET